MTNAESNQKFSTFLKAGYNAFRFAQGTGYFGFEGKVVPVLNPYSRNPFASLWQRGWDRAKSDWERNRQAYNPEQFVDNRRVSDYAKERQQAQQRKQQGQQRFKQQKQSKQKGKAVQRPPQRPQPKPLTPATPANLERLSNKLTKKYRTVI